MMDTMAAGELACSGCSSSGGLEAALHGGHGQSGGGRRQRMAAGELACSGCSSSNGFGGCAVWWTQWQQMSWLAVDAAALVDLEAALCGGHSGSR